MRYYFILLLVFFAPLHADSNLPAADDFMRQSTVDVLEQLNALSPGDRQTLLDIIEAEIMPHVDSHFMAKWVVGRQSWLQASQGEREDFIEFFMELLINSYANTLIIFKDRKIEFKLANKKSRTSNTAQVLCVVGQVGQEPIHVVFQMKVIDETWKIFDVIIEGISLLKGLKAQFSDDIHNFGIVGVTERIRRHQYQVKGPEL